MQLLYLDESGTSQIPGNTSHFILAGLAVPIWHWGTCDREVSTIKSRYGLRGKELHTGWIVRKYKEQEEIEGFATLSRTVRRNEVRKFRTAKLLTLQKSGNRKRYKQVKKNFAKTNDYIHLTLTERLQFVHDVADRVSQWGFARLFAECIDKIHFDPDRGRTIDEQSFEQIVSRFERYLQNIGGDGTDRKYGLLIHDNNFTVAKKHTDLMKSFHRTGTLWTQIQSIIETPLFVDSQLTSMVQVADLCAYALRRYLENNEETLFNLIFERADRRNGITVGVRHFSVTDCQCRICIEHRVNNTNP